MSKKHDLMIEIEDDVIRALRKGKSLSAMEVAAKIGRSVSAARDALIRLEDNGAVSSRKVQIGIRPFARYTYLKEPHRPSEFDFSGLMEAWQ